MIKNNPREFQQTDDKLYGMYRGVVEDNNSDPEKRGRCKIRVFGVHSPNKIETEADGIPTDELPWAEPALSLFGGSVSGFGAWTVPLQGSQVFVFFENGHILHPIYFASIPGIPTSQTHGFSEIQGFSDPDKKYPIEETDRPHQPNELKESDFHRLARGIIDSTIVEYKRRTTKKSEPDPYYSAQYPYNKVFATESGITIEVDDTPGEERIHVYHPSKSYVEIDKDGNINIRNAGNKYEFVDNKKLEFIDGDYTLYVGGKLYISAKNGIDMWSGGDINEDGADIHLNSNKAGKKNYI